MDLNTMKQKLSAGEYSSIEDFHCDISLMLDNCLEFNGREDNVGQVMSFLSAKLSLKLF